MELILFAIWDDKAQAFMPPWAMTTRGLALRSFGELANQEGHNIFNHPQDFRLFEIGTFNSATGRVEPLETGPHDLGMALQFKESPEMTP